ncbi:hypothetical protein AHAS_Ahas07G0092100 [Arachis hypogaea]
MQCTGNIVVNRFDRRNEVFDVREMPSGKVLVVDLALRRCDYGHFQVERLLCCHVYREEFVLLGGIETWLDYTGATLVANPALRRTLKGRPKSTRYLNEMNSRKMRSPWVCRLCRNQGHSRRRCSQRAGLSGFGGNGASWYL